MRGSLGLVFVLALLGAGCTPPLVDPPGATTDLGFDAFHRANALEIAIANLTSDLPADRIAIVPGSGDPVDATLVWVVRGALAARGTDGLVFPAGSEPRETEKRLVVWSVVLGGEEYRSFVFPPGAWLDWIGTFLGYVDPTGIAQIPFEVAYWIQIQTWAARQLLEESYEARGARAILRAELWDTKSGKLEWSREASGKSGRRNDL
ncbi:MAG: hypothetical protein ACAI25_07505 [Planctomycetota bacterium]